VRLRSKTILCVENSGPSNIERAAALRSVGYTVILTNDVKEALRIFISMDVDAVLLEFHLGNGKKNSLRAEMSSIRPRVPIVALCPAGFKSGVVKSLFQHVFREGDGAGALISVLQSLLA
jgi:DNA-binding NtrC family response regulator